MRLIRTISSRESVRCFHASTSAWFDVEVLSRHPELDVAVLKAKEMEMVDVRGWVPKDSLYNFKTSSRQLAVGSMLVAGGLHGKSRSVGIVSVGLQSGKPPFAAKAKAPEYDDGIVHDGEIVVYDDAVLPDNYLRKYIDTDLHLYVHESGLPVMHPDGELIGLVIATSAVGARIVIWKNIQSALTGKRLKESDTATTNPLDAISA